MAFDAYLPSAPMRPASRTSIVPHFMRSSRRIFQKWRLMSWEQRRRPRSGRHLARRQLSPRGGRSHPGTGCRDVLGQAVARARLHSTALFPLIIRFPWNTRDCRLNALGWIRSDSRDSRPRALQADAGDEDNFVALWSAQVFGTRMPRIGANAIEHGKRTEVVVSLTRDTRQMHALDSRSEHFRSHHQREVLCST